MAEPILSAMLTTLKNVFRPKTTEILPWKQVRERRERYRSTFALVHNDLGEEACIGCKMCEKICPSDIITVVAGGRKESPVTGKKRGYADDFILDLNACIVCELCVQVCPEDAILHLRVPQGPGYVREDLVLTMDKLYENEKRDAAAWGTGTGLIAMQDPKKGQPPAARPKPRPKPAPKAAPKPEAAPEAAPVVPTPTEGPPPRRTTPAADVPEAPALERAKPPEEGSA